MYAHPHTWDHAFETDTAATLDDKANQIYQPETQIYSLRQLFIWVHKGVFPT